MRQVFVKHGLKRAAGLLLVLFLMAGCGETSGTSVGGGASGASGGSETSGTPGSGGTSGTSGKS